MINKTLKQLEQSTKDNWSNPDELIKILSEIAYRKRQTSQKLGQEIVDHLCHLSNDCFLLPSNETVTSKDDNSHHWLDGKIIEKIEDGLTQYNNQEIWIQTFKSWKDLDDEPKLFYGGPNGNSPSRRKWSVDNDSQYQKSKHWRIGFSDEYFSSLVGLDNKLKGKLWDIIDKIQKNPMNTQGNTVKPLTANLKNLWRYRIGNWRLVYFPNKELNHIIFYYLKHRKEVYD